MSIPQVSKENARWLRLAGQAAVAVALLLIALKTWAWFVSDSVAMLGSLVDSLTDSAASIINLVAIRYALAPADDEHRFGHGKAEALAGLGQAAFICGSALFLLLQAVERLYNPAPLGATGIGIAVMLVSIVATLLLVLLQRFVIRRTGSLAVRADSLHYVGDLLMNAGIIVALLAAAAGHPGVDAWFAIGIALYLAWNARGIVNQAFMHLLDEEAGDDVRAEILALVRATPGVMGVHDLRTRLSGQQMFVQLHLEIDRDTPLWMAHGIAESVEQAIMARWPHCDVIVHEDPGPLPDAG